LHGREIAMVVDEWMPAGVHIVSFDAGQLPPGIYLYRGSNMGKLVVVK